jgi:hypothetical protein
VTAVEGQQDDLALRATQLLKGTRQPLPVQYFLDRLADLVPGNLDPAIAPFARRRRPDSS